MKFIKQLGISTLEVAICIPVLVAILLGLIDLFSYIRGRYVLTLGMEEAIRCLTTKESGCNSNSDLISKKFDIYTTSYNEIGNEYKISGNISIISTNPHSVKQGTATILDSVSYNSAGITAIEKRFKAIGKFEYIYRESPVINGDLNSQSVSDKFPLIIPTWKNKVLSTDSADNTQLSTDYIILDRPAVLNEVVKTGSDNTPCSKNLYSEDKKWIQCELWDREVNYGIEPVILISGNSVAVTNATIGDIGEVQLQLIESNGEITDLGGRLFQQQQVDSPENFVPRGADTSMIVNQDLKEYEEVNIYANATFIEYNKPFKIYFKLKSKNGNLVRWTPKSIKIILPKYSLEQTTINCVTPDNRGILSSEKDNLQLCSSKNGVKPNRDILSLTSLTQGDIIDLGCNHSTLNEADYEFIANHKQTCIKTQKCSDDNFGISDKAQSDGKIRNSKEALAICPPNNYFIDYTSIHWNEKDINLKLSEQEKILIPYSCDSPTLKSPYKKINLKTKIDKNKVVDANINYKLLNQYNCSNFFITTCSLSDEKCLDFKINQSATILQDPPCNSLDKQNYVRTALNLPENFALSISSLLKTGEYIKDKNSEPSCRPVKYRSFKKLIGTYSEGEIPEECKISECYFKINSYLKDSTTGINTKLAINKAYQAMQASWPAINLGLTSHSGKPTVNLSATVNNSINISGEFNFNPIILKFIPKTTLTINREPINLY
jgi:hypothetical protein